MNIDNALLFSYGGIVKSYNKGDYIIHEGEPARFYHQVLNGQVKLSCFNLDGKKFTFQVFKDGESFGEPSLFLNEKYPVYAISDTASTVIILSKDQFFQLLDDHPDYQKKFLYIFAGRLFNKTNTSKLIISENPESRIFALLTKYKKENTTMDGPVLIRHTRQEIADFTGLRIETVIRTVRKMYREQKLIIRDRKIYF